ncbi:MAG: hypothetical protein GX644_02970 [Limnobacter sp.]|nr:hypothetical protein [Limnobacter sp.]
MTIRSPLGCLAFALVLLAGIDARADYLPLTLAALFGESQLVVEGTIDRVDDESFTVRPVEVFAGSVGSGPLRVKKYADWTGGRRWRPYRPGQNVLLFLSKPPTGERAADDDWRIRGRAGEGEMPIDDGAVFPHGLYIDGFRRQRFEVDGGELYGYRFDRDTFESALEGYLRCLAPSRERAAAAAGRPRSGCTDAEIRAYGASSALHRHLLSSGSVRTR